MMQWERLGCRVALVGAESRGWWHLAGRWVTYQLIDCQIVIFFIFLSM